MEGSVKNEVIEGTVAMLAEVEAYYRKDLPDPILPTTELTPEQQQHLSYVNAMDALKESIEDTENGGQETFWQKIATEKTTGEQPVEKLSTHLRNVLLMLAGRNQTLQDAWKRSWRLADEETGTAATVTKAQVTYNDNTLGDKYYFSKPVEAGGTSTSPWIPFDADTLIAGYNYEGFNWVGFANELGNNAKTITLGYEENGSMNTVETLTVSNNAAQTSQGTNYWYQVRYRPIASIAAGSENEAIPICLNLENALPFTQTAEELDNLKKVMLEALNDGKTDDEDKIGSLSEYWITVNVPDLQHDMNISPSWSNPEQVNR